MAKKQRNEAYRKDQINKIKISVENDPTFDMALRTGRAHVNDITQMATVAYDEAKARIYPKWFRALYAMLYDAKWVTIFLVTFILLTIFYAKEAFSVSPFFTLLFASLPIAALVITYVLSYKEVE